MNIHLHALVLDGGYDEAGGKGLRFNRFTDGVSADDVAWAVSRIARRSVAMLAREGYLESGADPGSGEGSDAMELVDDASIENRIAFGERAGKPVRRLRLKLDDAKPTLRDGLVATMHGFNLKADRLLKAHQRWKLARLVRYVSRPPIANERLQLSNDGRTVRYVMKKPWSDGTTEVLLSGTEFVEKLAAAVPPPNGHLVRYFGVLAPNSAIRHLVVPKPKPRARDECGKLKLSATQRKVWAELIKHAFMTDLTKCARCGGEVRRIAIIRNSETIAKILSHIARAPPSD